MSEEFDDIIRQKFAEKEFIFNEANWEKAEIKIDAALKLKKLLLWGTLFSVGLITGICCMVLWKKDKQIEKVQTTKTEFTTTNDTRKTSTILSDTYNSKLHSSNGSVSETKATDRKEHMNQPVVFNDNQASSKSGEKNNSTGSDRAIPVDNYLTNEKVKTAHTNQKTTDKVSTASGTERDIAKKNPLSKKNAKLPFTETKNEENKNPVSTQNKSFVKTNKKKTKQSTATPGDQAENEQIDATHLTMKTNFAEKGTKPKKVSDEASESVEKATTLTKNSLVAKDKNAAAKNTSDIKNTLATDSTKNAVTSDSSLALKSELNTPATVAGDSLNDSIKLLTVSDSMERKKDSVPNLNKIADPVTPLDMDGIASINLFFIDAGANAQIGWKYINVKEAQGITPIFGISMIHYFNQKWSVNAGLQYSNIAYLKTNTFNSVTNYSFGVTTNTSIFKPYTLHYVGVPLYVNYHVTEKNAIFAGVGFSYLMNNKIRVQSGQSYTITPSYVQNISSSPNEIRNGFYNNFDVSIAAGYRRKLNGHFSIAPVFYFGLTDIKKDSFFGLNQFERNSGLKLILSYSIFDF